MKLDQSDTLWDVPIIMGPRNAQEIRSMIVDAIGLDDEERDTIGGRLGNGIRTLVFSVLRLLSGVSSAPSQQVPSDLRRVVLFRYDAIGDYIISTPFIRWLKSVAPEVEIDIVGSYRNASILEADPNIRSVVQIDPSASVSLSWLKVRSLIKSRKPDMIAALVFTKMTKAALLSMAGGGSASRVTIDVGRRGTIYSKVFDRQAPHFEAWEHWFETMANVGTRTYGLEEEEPAPYIVLTDDALAGVAKDAQANGRSMIVPQHDGIVRQTSTPVDVQGAPYFVLNVAASVPERVLNTETASHLVRHLLELHVGYHCVVTGGPEHASLIESIVENINDNRCTLFRGNLPEAVALGACSSLIVTPDTAIVHVGSVARVPVLSFSSQARSIAEWGPYGVPYRSVLSADPTDINSIGVQIMKNALDELTADIDLPAFKSTR